jgi:hypothetical protein
MARRVPVSTRLSGPAAARLRKRAEQARVGVSSYASHLLEIALLGEGAVTNGMESEHASLAPHLVERGFAELLFVSAALERFLAKQGGLVAKLRAEAIRGAAETVGSTTGTDESADPTLTEVRHAR